MSVKQPAMSPSEMPVAEVLSRAPGTRRDEAEQLLALFQEITGLPRSSGRSASSASVTTNTVTTADIVDTPR